MKLVGLFRWLARRRVPSQAGENGVPAAHEPPEAVERHSGHHSAPDVRIVRIHHRAYVESPPYRRTVHVVMIRARHVDVWWLHQPGGSCCAVEAPGVTEHRLVRALAEDGWGVEGWSVPAPGTEVSLG